MAKRVSLAKESKAPKNRTVVRAKVRTATKLYRMIQKMDVPITMKEFLEMVVAIAIDLSFQSREWELAICRGLPVNSHAFVLYFLKVLKNKIKE